jgi:hypothetical protein
LAKTSVSNLLENFHQVSYLCMQIKFVLCKGSASLTYFLSKVRMIKDIIDRLNDVISRSGVD